MEVFFIGLLQLIVINIVLSGDNAVQSLFGQASSS